MLVEKRGDAIGLGAGGLGLVRGKADASQAETGAVRVVRPLVARHVLDVEGRGLVQVASQQSRLAEAIEHDADADGIAGTVSTSFPLEVWHGSRQDKQVGEGP